MFNITHVSFYQEVNVCQVLKQVRAQRMYMVQTIGQYTMVYKALIQYLSNSRLI